MSADGDDFVPPSDDPFAANDPAAIERERRRAQRDAKRQRRSSRVSLGERVSGALDGATTKGREAIEHGRERVAAPKDAPSEGAAPPAFRRAPAPREDEAPAAAAAETRAPAASPPASAKQPDALEPEPQPKQQPPPASVKQPAPVEPLQPRPVPQQPAAEAPRSQPAGPAAGGPQAPPIPLHGETDDFAPPAPVPAGTIRRIEREGAPGAQEPSGARRFPRLGSGGSGATWARRLLAVVGIVLLAVGAAFVVSRTGDEEEPAPAAKGPAKLKTIDVTIPEGLSRAEMAAVAKDAGLKGDYERESAKPPKGFDAKEYGFPGDASLEGFLFPATYNLEKGAPVEDLVSQQLAAFEQNLAEVDTKAAKGKNLTVYDVVTIASMIEREVQVAKERPIVAAVIYNRLADGEPLGIDATLRYEVGFDEPLTESQLASDSPYNTRINPGLPPTPIGNPGLDSLKAAADPANVDFKYYVFKPGSCGEHSFTADYDEFINLSNEYQAALEAEGGQPTSC